MSTENHTCPIHGEEPCGATKNGKLECHKISHMIASPHFCHDPPKGLDYVEWREVYRNQRLRKLDGVGLQ